MRGLKGKTALVTGAAGGIGSAICRRFVEEGVRVAALDIDEAGLGRLAAALGPAAPASVACDIADHGAVAGAVARLAAEFGRIDILINNAGWDAPKPFLETTPDFWTKVIDVNLIGPLNLHHAVLPHMVRAKAGAVVNIASDAGRVGSSGEAVYSACKGGIIAFTKTLAREVARHGIRLNSVCPGPTDTPLLRSFLQEGEYGQKLYEGLKRAIPLHRLGEPEDLPGIVAFLASADAGFITGEVISVSGGLTMHG
ncbi:MAG TPA: glucose 1-dehydrogenase [Stellaceae bacterium]|jgi:2-hydroxycyclohexanecarboxyl-CoA dehydrogenase|nr:glucose 1-dehydrogenase [Stellaceae bacterium]